MTIPTPIYKDAPLPNAKARELAMELPTTLLGQEYCLIDNICRVYLAQKYVIERNIVTALLVLHLSMQPIAGVEPHPRKETLYIDKLAVEGISNEFMKVLG